MAKGKREEKWHLASKALTSLLCVSKETRDKVNSTVKNFHELFLKQ